MKKFWMLTVILLTFALAACSQDGENNNEETNSDSSGKKVIQVGATPNGYPHFFKENDELKGFDIDVIETVMDKAGYEVEWVVADWAGLVASLQTGKIDSIADFGVTPERQESYNFTNPYFYSQVGISLAPDNDSISSLEDLKGKTVGNLLGSNYGNTLKENDPDDEIEMITYDAPEIIIQDVATGKIDAYITGREALLAQAKDNKIQLKVLPEGFGEKPVAMPFAKTEENEQVIADLNKAIEELHADGTLKEISEQWFSIDVTQSNEQ